MVMTDPIADFLTRVRNANIAMKKSVDIPNSNIKASLSKILKDEGFIKDYEVITEEDSIKKNIRIFSFFWGKKYEQNKSYIMYRL